MDMVRRSNNQPLCVAVRMRSDFITKDVCILHGGEFRVKKMPPHAQFNFDTYIFDLDGTLLSTLGIWLRAAIMPSRRMAFLSEAWMRCAALLETVSRN